MKRRRPFFALAAVLVLAVLTWLPPPAVRVAFEPFTTQPERYSSLYFVDHDGPVTRTAGRAQVRFVVANSLGATHTYTWQARASDANGNGVREAAPVAGTVTLDTGASVEIATVIATPGNASRVDVELVGESVRIHRWIDDRARASRTR